MLDALKLMRIPFSVFLMPVFWFALVNVSELELSKSLLVFVIIHLLVYPASNGYNSYFDKDEGSIGGLRNPPRVNRNLFPLVVAFDLLSVVLSYILSPSFCLLIIIYILVSKAYSYDKIRLKKYPILSTLVVVVFQGFFMFLTVQIGVGETIETIWVKDNIMLAVCSSLFLLGSYPLTQVYQHKEDSQRGDRTLSLMLGIKGTFIFSSFAFLIGSLALFLVFIQQGNVNQFFCFLALGLPILVYFNIWFLKVLKDKRQANFDFTMRMNIISSLCLSLAFIAMLFME